MDDKGRRNELVAEYKATRPDAGVYRIVNTATGKSLLGSTTNLASIRNRVDFARNTNSPGALDGRLARDLAAYGLDAFTFEALETVKVSPEASRSDVASELATLEALWREKLGEDSLY